MGFVVKLEEAFLQLFHLVAFSTFASCTSKKLLLVAATQGQCERQSSVDRFVKA